MSDPITELIRLGRYLFERFYVGGSAGNLSIRLDRERIALTPSGSSLGELKADRISILSREGERIAGDKPTKEAGMHLEIYKRKPQTQVVIHLHSTYLTALSCLEGLDADNALRPCTPYLVMRLGQVPVAPYHKPGSDALVAAIAPLVERHKAVVLANHGVLVAGDSVVAARNDFEELEESAKLYFLLKGSSTRFFTPTERAELSHLRP